MATGKTLLLAAKQEFISLLNSSVELADVQVSLGHPGAEQLEHEAIWIVETVEWTQEVAAVAGTMNPLKETIAYVVHFLAAKPGQYTAEEAEARVVDLFEAVQGLVRDTANFKALRSGTAVAGSQLLNIQLIPNQSTPMFGPEGRVNAIEAHLKVESRI